MKRATHRPHDIRSPGRRLPLLALLGGFAVLSGCSNAPTDSRLMHLLFTGIPQPHGAAPVDLATRKKQAKRTALRRARPTLFVHGPYAVRACDLCHATSASVTFTAIKRTAATARGTALPRGFGQRLVYPIDQLCVSCHTEKSARSATRHGDWLHGPVATGRCVICHSPHQSQRRYMLKKADNKALCLECHSEKSNDYARREGLWIHGPVGNGECTWCHAPHGSRQRYLLEAKNVVALCTACHLPADLGRNKAHPPAPLPECTQCHNPHLGKTAQMLKLDYNEYQL